jgi:hypothetical protein
MNEGHPTLKFERRVKSTSVFIWPQKDDISEIEIRSFQHSSQSLWKAEEMA